MEQYNSYNGIVREGGTFHVLSRVASQLKIPVLVCVDLCLCRFVWCVCVWCVCVCDVCACGVAGGVCICVCMCTHV